MGIKKTFVYHSVIFLILYSGIGFFSFSQEVVSDALKERGKSVVTLSFLDEKQNELYQGKGLIVSSDGLVLTNYHLVCQSSSAKALVSEETIRQKIEWDNVFYPGYQRTQEKTGKPAGRKSKGKWVDVKGLAGVDRDYNLALLRIDKKKLNSAPLSQSLSFGVGDKVLIVSEAESLSESSLTSLQELSKGITAARLSHSLPQEMSGSPLFNDNGEAIGIVACFGEKETVVIPAACASSLLESQDLLSLNKLEPENYLASSEGLYLKGVTCLLQGNDQEALTCFQEAARINPNHSRAWCAAGSTSFNLKNFTEAKSALQRSVETDPQNDQAYYWLGLTCLRLNQPQEAAQSLIQATQLNPENPDAFYNLGIAFEETGQLSDAAQAYERFVAINPGPAWTGLNQLGSVYMEMGQFEKAIGVFDKVIQNNPQDLKATYNLAAAYDNSGNFPQAAELYQRLIQLNPNDSLSYLSLLFRLYHKAEDFPKAIEVCHELIQLNPQNPQNHYNLGITHFRMEEYDQALQAFEEAVRFNPQFDLAYYNTGLVHFKRKKYAEAAEAFEKFCLINPESPDAYYNLGAAYMQLKKYDEALEPFQKAISIKPDYDLAHYNLGLAYYALGDRYSANIEYKTLLELNPELAGRLAKIIRK
ncbi:MAG: tetratricopeptide repeat protein [Acidobacteriota bacterium]